MSRTTPTAASCPACCRPRARWRSWRVRTRGRRASPSDNNVSWDLSGTYALDKDINLYARVATGFRAPSMQGAGAFSDQSVAEAETITSFEAGIKADLFDRRARLSFSVFQYNVKDQQLTAVGGAANVNILINAEKATGQGFELDFQAFLTDNLLVTRGRELQRHRDQGRRAWRSPSAAAAARVDRPASTAAAASALIDGNPLPQAPKRTAQLHRCATAQPVGDGEFFAVSPTGSTAARSTSSCTKRSSSPASRCSKAACASATTGATANTKWPPSAATSPTRSRIVGGIDFNNLTGFINEPRTSGVQFKADVLRRMRRALLACARLVRRRRPLPSRP